MTKQSVNQSNKARSSRRTAQVWVSIFLFDELKKAQEGKDFKPSFGELLERAYCKAKGIKSPNFTI